MLFSFLILCAVIGYLLAPIDFIWFIVLSLVSGIAESVFFLIRKKNRKFGMLVLFVELSSLAIYSGFIKSAYHYYHAAWNIVYFILTSAVLFAPCYIFCFQRQSEKKKKLGFLVIAFIVGLKSVAFDTRYYYAATGSCLVQDVRHFKDEGYYKVIGNHKLLRKNPDALTAEDYEAVLYLLNKTDWLKEQFPEKSAGRPPIDSCYLKNNSTYICSSIGLYAINRCDIYRLRIPLDKGELARLYIPKGTFTIYDEDDIEKYYGKQPTRIHDCGYEGVLLPPLTEKLFKEWTR